MRRISNWIKNRLQGVRPQGGSPQFPVLFARFQEILSLNNKILELIAGANDKLGGDYIFDQHYIMTTCRDIEGCTRKLIYNLDTIAPRKYPVLPEIFQNIQTEIDEILAGKMHNPETGFIVPYSKIGRDSSDAVGGKNANLSELKTYLGIKIPSGFAITCNAFRAFLDHNGLSLRIKKITDAWSAGSIETEQASEKITAMIIAGKLPHSLEKAMSGAVASLAGPTSGKKLFLAVRSSAWGEDSSHTFAGQYLSLINEPAENLNKAYIKVLASAYESNAMEYRRLKGFKESEVSMAVACQEMVTPKASGVLYTLDPQNPEKEVMLANATWGLGSPLVSGRTAADQYLVDRKPPYRCREVNLVRKELMQVQQSEGGTGYSPVQEDKQTSASISNEQITKLAGIGLLIEKYFRKPQDIEFAIDQNGEIVILQTRQLSVKHHKAPRATELANLSKKYPVIFQDRGVIAQKGIASGPVFLVKNDHDLLNFPNGAMLVTKSASPLLAKAITRAAAIITDVGSAAGHLATIAREFRVPALFDTSVATLELSPGEEITLDAEENIVYRGAVRELNYYGLLEESIEETFEYRLLRRVLKMIEPLNLLDPSEKNFKAAACRTIHDITRFVHEKAVETIIDLNYYQHQDPRTAAGKLNWDIPLDLVIIDIGGGLGKNPERKAAIRPEEIISIPMRAMLAGMKHPGAWNSEPMSVDFGSFMSSLTRTRPSELSAPKQVGQNLAVISGEYANISLRLGYHFTMIDSYITSNINDNYAYFRFFGGVTDATRRSRRAKFLGEILAQYDFRVELHDDLIVARIKKLDEQNMRNRLYLLGLLVSFTRQLDVKMVSEDRVESYVAKIKTLMEENHEQY